MRPPEQKFHAELSRPGPGEIPSDRPSEERFIGCCLMGGAETTAEGMDLLRSEHFYTDDCRRAFLVLAAMMSDLMAITVPTFLSAWRGHHNDGSEKPYLKTMMEIMDAIPAPSMIGHYAGEIVKTAQRRRVYIAAHGILATLNDQTQSIESILATAETELMAHDTGSIPHYDGPACARALMDDLEARMARQGQPTGILTGFTDLDNKTDGLQIGEQIILAARPGMGKTAMGLCIAHRACVTDGVPTLFVTMEMNKEALLRRLCAIHAAIPMFTLRKGTFVENHFPKIANFSAALNQAPLHVLDAVGGADDQELASAIRRKIRQHGIKLVIIDYLQKIRASRRNEKRTYEVAQVSGTLKAITSRHNVAMLTLAQLNRESDKTKGQAPRLSDLADSGQIERDADVVLLLHRDRDNPDTEANLILSKNRDGEGGVTLLLFDGRYCKFVNRAKIEPDDLPPPHHSEPAEQQMFHTENQ